MSTSDRILTARNALALFENLLLEAYVTADSDTLTKALANHLAASTEIRESISNLYSLATALEGRRQAHPRRA